jgi:hypothetical protein
MNVNPKKILMTTHRAIQLSVLEDKLSSMARQDRIRAGKAAAIGNKQAASFFVNRARKADTLLQYRVMPRLS